MKLEFSWQIFEKYWNIILYENPSRDSRVDRGRQTDGRADDRQTSLTKLIVAFWNFAYAPRNTCIFYLNTPCNCTELWRWYLPGTITQFVGFICLSVFWKNTPCRKWGLFQPEVKTGKVPRQVLSSEWENLNYWITIARFEDNDNNKTCHKEIRWRLWTGFTRPRTETSDDLLWTQSETFGFRNKWGKS